MGHPLMDGRPATNVDEEHIYKCRVVFGASTVFSARGNKDVTITRPTSTTVKLSFTKPYAEITTFHVGRKAAASVAGLEWIITTNNITDSADPYVTLTSIESDPGTATAPATDDVAYIEIGFSSSTLEDRYVASG